MYGYVCNTHGSQKRVSVSPRAGVTGGCDLPSLGAGNQTIVLQKSICTLKHRAISPCSQNNFQTLHQVTLFSKGAKGQKGLERLGVGWGRSNLHTGTRIASATISSEGVRAGERNTTFLMLWGVLVNLETIQIS